MARIRAIRSVGAHVEAMTPTLEVFAMLQFHHVRQRHRHHPAGPPDRHRSGRPRPQSAASSEHLVYDQASLRFQLRRKLQHRPSRLRPDREALIRHNRRLAAASRSRFRRRRRRPDRAAAADRWEIPPQQRDHSSATPSPASATARPSRTSVEGRCTCSHPGDDGHHHHGQRPAADAGQSAASAFTAAGDYFKSEMSEYDSNYVFVPLEYLQTLRGRWRTASPASRSS